MMSMCAVALLAGGVHTPAAGADRRPPRTGPPPVPNGFVTRDPTTGNLMLDGQRFRFSGANAPYLGLSEDSSAYGAPVDADGLHLASHSEIDATLDSAQAMSAKVIRAYSSLLSVGKTNAIQPTLGVFNSAGFEPTDYLLSQCAARGIKLVFPLVDNYQYYVGGKFWYCTENGVTPDSVASQFFTNTTIINSFKAHISAVLNRVNQYTGLKYKNDPTILAWETGNEINMVPETGISAWADEISRHIKLTEGAQQLVADGNTELDAASFDLDYVDIYCNHSYGGTLAQIVTNATTVHSHGKAFFLGEYTWTDKDTIGFGTSWTLTQMLSAIEASTYVDGDNFWELLAPLAQFGGGFVLHWPGDDANMVTRATQLANHALKMRHLAPPE
jgi:mannan endo-1,4-beta-mannosidase